MGLRRSKAVRHLTYKVRFLGLVAIAALAGMWPMAAQAATVPGLGSAGNFAVLSAAPGHGGAVTCTTSSITGNVGSSGVRASIVNTGPCTITGSIIAPVSTQVVADFNSAYSAFGQVQCGTVLTTLDGQILSPGVYCIDAAATSTSSTLTLNGPSTGTWIFKIGTSGTGALTGTSFNVVMLGGGQPCNVDWWVAQAATMTDSHFLGTILAGAAITITRGTFTGDALATAAVTMKNTTLVGCPGSSSPSKGHKGQLKEHCNQGVGNGPEGCDPGNSNQGDPSRSNDELGGTPGDPGRKGGNGK
jgi:Ice-binding-like